MAQLLIDPEPRQGVCRQAAQEILTRLDFEKFHIINKQFEGNLQGDGVVGGFTGRLWNARPEMFGASWWRGMVKIIRKEIPPPEP